MAELQELRVQIDEIDRKLIELFEKRMEVVAQVAEYKLQKGIPILDSEREKAVIEKNLSMLKNKQLEAEAKDFFEHLMALSRSFQAKKHLYPVCGLNNMDKKGFQFSKKRVGFQGVSGSFGEQALNEYFGDGVEKSCFPGFEDIFKALEEGKIDYGVLPIENSSTGSITEVYDLLRRYNFFITGERCVKVQQNLLGIKGAVLADIKEVYTIPTAYEQCREFFKDHPGIKFIPFHNTAASAEYIKKMGDKHKAAIASKRAAEVFDLDILQADINHNKRNMTRFIIISRQMEVDEKCNKISVVFALEHKAGSLYRALRYFAENNLNMLRIESRPMEEKSWQYFFYIDFEGNTGDDRVKQALKLIENNSFYFRLLGNYQSHDFTL